MDKTMVLVAMVVAGFGYGSVGDAEIHTGNDAVDTYDDVDKLIKRLEELLDASSLLTEDEQNAHGLEAENRVLEDQEHIQETKRWWVSNSRSTSDRTSKKVGRRTNNKRRLG